MMATWHQQRAGGILPHIDQWSIVTDPPDDCRAVWLERTEAAAIARLDLWRANGRDVRHSYILAPQLRFERTKQ